MTLSQDTLCAIALHGFDLIERKMSVVVHFFKVLSSFDIHLSPGVITQDTALMIAFKIVVYELEVKKKHVKDFRVN